MKTENINLYHCLLGYDSVYVASKKVLTSEELCESLNNICDKREMEIKVRVSEEDDSLYFIYTRSAQSFFNKKEVHVNRTVIDNVL
ncbi:hypothetical protein [Clostridium fallax]|uniref:Uncharacterized protein n=1 Tax=Clostridium fallax TaxID=1533 RepID=A0A1M4XZ04_9CLOT|nr:hypothetical protein [Clostridium fallax]SHE98658.1 hypothetical protein SAMN05443638_12221 [Clostridium fallax]SQB06488.1 Uncharacterised protein [Clostridium fallax]